MVVIAILLIAFSGGTIAANFTRMARGIDHELRDRALRPQPGPPGQPGGIGPIGRNPEDGPPPNQRPFENNGQLPPRFNDPVAIQFADLRRPRRFNSEGRPLGMMRDDPFDRIALKRALRGQESYSDGLSDGVQVRIFTAPILNGPNSGGAIQVAQDKRGLADSLQQQVGTLLIFLPAAVLIAGFSALFLTGRAMRPIASMQAAAARISAEDLSQRLPMEGGDEFAELGGTFNATFDRLQDGFVALNAAFENQKRFTADASHELRTPLTRLRLATSSALAAGATEEERNKALTIADEAASTVGRLVQEMLVLARSDAGHLAMQIETLDLRVLVAETVDQMPAREPEITLDLQDSAVLVQGDKSHLERVLSNVLDNAQRHTPETGQVTVTVCSSESEVILRIADTGEGIAPEHLPHLGERFYRADAARNRADGGAGLGLAICKTIVEAHGGTMEIESKLGQGTVIEIHLPK